jgi:hypothetical protein
MKGFIDRIEDGETAVVIIEGGGQMTVPVSQFGIEVHEGAHLDIDIRLNVEREKKIRNEIRDLRDELLKGNKDEDKR